MTRTYDLWHCKYKCSFQVYGWNHTLELTWWWFMLWNWQQMEEFCKAFDSIYKVAQRCSLLVGLSSFGQEQISHYPLSHTAIIVLVHLFVPQSVNLNILVNSWPFFQCHQQFNTLIHDNNLHELWCGYCHKSLFENDAGNRQKILHGVLPNPNPNPNPSSPEYIVDIERRQSNYHARWSFFNAPFLSAHLPNIM